MPGDTTQKPGPGAHSSEAVRAQNIVSCINEPRHVKTNKVTVRPAKTQISLGIRPDWSVFAVRLMGV